MANSKLPKGSKQALEWGQKMKQLRQAKKQISGNGVAASVMDLSQLNFYYSQMVPEFENALTISDLKKVFLKWYSRLNESKHLGYLYEEEHQILKDRMESLYEEKKKQIQKIRKARSSILTAEHFEPDLVKVADLIPNLPIAEEVRDTERIGRGILRKNKRWKK